MEPQFQVIGTKKKLHSSNPNKKPNKKSKRKKKSKKEKSKKRLKKELEMCNSELHSYKFPGGVITQIDLTSNSQKKKNRAKLFNANPYQEQSIPGTNSNRADNGEGFVSFSNPTLISRPKKNFDSQSPETNNSFVSSMSYAPTSKPIAPNQILSPSPDHLPIVSEEQAIFMLRNLRDSQNQPILPWLQNIYYNSVLEGKEQEKFNLILNKILPMQNSALYEFFIKKNEVLRQELVPWHARENNQYLYTNELKRLGGKKRRKKRKKRQNKSRKKRTRKKKKKKKKNKKKKTRKR